ncbi:nuclear transport factor 2 family protein [Goodfellowiella coeruleoviolacea]|uniref:Ketosteroid isomerase-related protein n=1 Tax=Goodfellowiella coeruleoviolacea TaxID=334858 RepID=A0AAE3GFH1_9PSEU|nr:nuclear transport factor 2 family protein [Goodfellowiella coeruleoviolacea]MCP2167282.1 Ketosteroid isomerase-related protein [Goodfellowiella coeruleoviolacea]
MSASPRTARDLFEESLRRLLAKDMTGYAALWAADGVFEFPFAPANYPTRLVGRSAVEDYLRGYPDLLDVREITECTVHETADPDVVVAEFEAAGRVVATGRPYRMRYVAVVTARDGEITRYRDYWSPLAGAELMGGLDELTSAFATTGAQA